MVRQMVVASTTVIVGNLFRTGLMSPGRRLPEHPVWRAPRDALPTSPAYSPCTRSVRTVGWEGRPVRGVPIPIKASILNAFLIQLIETVFEKYSLIFVFRDL